MKLCCQSRYHLWRRSAGKCDATDLDAGGHCPKVTMAALLSLDALELFAQECTAANISNDGLKAVIQRLLSQQRKALAPEQQQIRMPLQFDSTESEVNFHALAGCISTCAFGYESLLQTTTQQGLRDVALFGVMGLYLSGQNLDNACLAALTLAEVGEHFRIPLRSMQGIAVMPGVEQLPDHPLKPLAERVLACLHALADGSQQRGFTTFGGFLLHASKATAPEQPSAVGLRNALCTSFPLVFEEPLIETLADPLATCATCVVDTCFRRFRQQLPDHFNYGDRARLPAILDHSLIVKLRKLHVLDVTEAASKMSLETTLTTMRVLAGLAVARICTELVTAPDLIAITACDVDFALRSIPEGQHDACSH
eukprot:m.100152 g.100152  ORF g.100152 m.100152 type:complete len:368 (-) comp15116_c0_seq3:70-1173(-)